MLRINKQRTRIAVLHLSYEKSKSGNRIVYFCLQIHKTDIVNPSCGVTYGYDKSDDVEKRSSHHDEGILQFRLLFIVIVNDIEADHLPGAVLFIL